MGGDLNSQEAEQLCSHEIHRRSGVVGEWCSSSRRIYSIGWWCDTRLDQRFSSSDRWECGTRNRRMWWRVRRSLRAEAVYSIIRIFVSTVYVSSVLVLWRCSALDDSQNDHLQCLDYLCDGHDVFVHARSNVTAGWSAGRRHRYLQLVSGHRSCQPSNRLSARYFGHGWWAVQTGRWCENDRRLSICSNDFRVEGFSSHWPMNTEF